MKKFPVEKGCWDYIDTRLNQQVVRSIRWVYGIEDANFNHPLVSDRDYRDEALHKNH